MHSSEPAAIIRAMRATSNTRPSPGPTLVLVPDQLPWYAATPTSADDRRRELQRELQRELIVVNTRDGLAAARARGRNGGRRPRLNADQVALAQWL